MAKIIRGGAEWAGWSAVALSVWLLTLSSVSGAELIVSCGAAAICGLAASAARRVLGLRVQPSTRILRWLRRLPAAIVVDTFAVLTVPWRRRPDASDEGDWERVPVAPGPEPLDSTTRAAATLLVSVPPGSFVVHDDVDTGELLVHRLVDTPASLTEVVRR